MTLDRAATENGPGTPIAPFTSLDRYTRSGDVVVHAFLAAQVDGGEPFVRSLAIDQPIAPARLLPDGSRVERSVTDDTSVIVLARCLGGTVLISAQPRSAAVNVSARTDEMAAALLHAIRDKVPAIDLDGKVTVRTWHTSLAGTTSGRDRRIDAPAWRDIAHNYPAAVRAHMERLVAVARPTSGAKLILWHGEPGTGKTTALRALFREWEPWCSPQYIADPERFFASPAYISDVLTRSPHPQHGPTLEQAGDQEARWRLIVAEDSDEYLRASARRDAGAGLGRLLNLADGVLGQGFNVLILLTTNEEMNRLHPALVRPGRCLARLAFGRFPVDQAAAWLANTDATPAHPLTLAELYEARGDLDPIGGHHGGHVAAGHYL